LDGFYARTGRLLGPLHRMPISLKDQFHVKGHDSTLGYVGRAFQPAPLDCVLVSMLRHMGAVIMAKSNLPQSIMVCPTRSLWLSTFRIEQRYPNSSSQWCETENPLWGLTTHPLRADFTPSGSTGGRAALLSLRDTVVGWGTDMGGSIRIPAHMNGLYGLKPSVRVPTLPQLSVAVAAETSYRVHASLIMTSPSPPKAKSMCPRSLSP